MPSKAVQAVIFLSAAVGLLTGVGTVVGWIASGSLLSTLSEAAIIAGIVYVIGCSVGLAGLIAVAIRNAMRNRHAVRAAIYAVLIPVIAVETGGVVYWGAIKHENLGYFTPFGYGSVALFVGLVAWFGYATYAGSQRECPDCAETVKAKARVCRYCGFRFQEPAIPE